MKKLLQAVVSLLLLTTIITIAHAQGTAFTYQGRLTDSGVLPNGKYDLRFNIYDALSAGSLIAGPITNSAVPVTNGLFTVTIDFGAGVFAGPSRWLEIAARSNTVAVAFIPLTPRQQLTPTPYAITSENVDGPVPAGQLTGVLPAGLLSGVYGNPVTLNNPGNTIAGNGGAITNVNAAALNGLVASNFWQLGGNAGTTPGPNYLGTPDNKAVEIHVNGARGFRVEPDSTYSTPNVIGGSAANFVAPGWVGNFIGAGSQAGFSSNYITGGNLNVIGGGWDNHSTNGYENVIAGGAYNTVAGGSATIGGGNNNNVQGYGATVPGGNYNTALGQNSFAAGQNAQALNDGSFVWADNSSATPFTSTAINQFLLRSSFTGINRNGPVTGSDVFAVRSPVTSGYGGMYIETAGTNGWPFYGYALNGSAYAWTYLDGSDANKWKLYNGGNWLTVDRAGQVGINTTTPSAAKLDVNGDVRIDNHELFLTSGSTTNNGSGLGYRINMPGISSDGPFLYGYNGGALGGLGPTTIALSWDYRGNIWVSNNASVGTLTIRGGADLAEPFNITLGKDEVPQGAVVVIDEENPGHLKLSSRSYDTHVAGVVSGANGVNPGIQMQQQGLIDGGKNVALTGRVYVQADASNGAIKPGDLLTTSSTPGHAMKVSNHAKAAGAILGKAMTGLAEGKGMVLVLVSLQ